MVKWWVWKCESGVYKGSMFWPAPQLQLVIRPRSFLANILIPSRIFFILRQFSVVPSSGSVWTASLATEYKCYDLYHVIRLFWQGATSTTMLCCSSQVELMPATEELWEGDGAVSGKRKTSLPGTKELVRIFSRSRVHSNESQLPTHLDT
jgi:hypothetical protein